MKIDVPTEGYGTVHEAQMGVVIALAEFFVNVCETPILRHTSLLRRAERNRDQAMMRLFAWRYKMARDIERGRLAATRAKSTPFARPDGSAH